MIWIELMPLLIVLVIVGTILHIIGALFYAAHNKRSGWEACSYVLAMILIWPIFTIRMMCRGYNDFLEKECNE